MANIPQDHIARRQKHIVHSDRLGQVMRSPMLSVFSTLAVLFTGTLHARAQAADPNQKSSPDQLVDSLNGVFGKQTFNRAVHAKGVVLKGTFTPSPGASVLSKAPQLQSASVPVTVRFSDFAGVPKVPDTDPNASPRGFALKFLLPDGSETDLVTHSFNGFPVATADEFHDLMIALAASGPNSPKPTPLDKFLENHPTARTFLTTQKPPPVSYAVIPYFGVNSFKFTNAKGDSVFGRYRIEPVAIEEYLSKDQISRAEPGYLADEIRARVSKGPIKFHLLVQRAGPGDKIDDPSIAWPDTREKTDLGIIEIDKAVDDSDAEERALMFLPAALPEGIESADPMITARSEAYPISFARRHQ